MKMRSTWKQMISLMIVLVMLLSICLPVVAQSADGETEICFDKVEMDGPAPLGALNSGYISNEYIEAYINSEGHYTMGTVAGDPNSDTDDDKLLLFGHPDSSTTETLIRIDGIDYYFDNYVTDVEFNDDATECVATAVIDGLTIQQVLTLITNPYTGIEDLMRIRYTYSNTSDSAKQVGVRIMLDTMLGSNDGAPFRVNGEEVTSEREFSGNNVPQYWQCFDSLQEPNVTSTGFFYFSGSEKPDKVQFAYWPDINGSSWSYAVETDKSFTSDSAVAAYFNPRTVAVGGTYSVVTYYGISGFSGGNSDLQGELGVRITAPSELTGSTLNAGYLNNPFDVTAYVTNTGEGMLPAVRAVLSLADAPELSLASSQSTTIELGDLYSDQNATIQWTLRAEPQAEATVAQYNIYFYSGDTLLKTMTLSLDLAALSEEEIFRTVTFDLNGGDGRAPAAQRVRVGGHATQPAAPSREGYIFGGWYANRDCTGSKWFNAFNDYQGNVVEEDVTLYAKWYKAQDLIFGEDTFSFENTHGDFFENDWFDNYWLTGDYFRILLQDRSFAERTDLILQMLDGWGGSCFGMSAVLSLVRAGELDVEFFQGDADCLYDLDEPRISDTMFNLINYYHLTQLTDRTAEARGDYDRSNETSNNRRIIEALDESAYPVVIGFDISGADGKKLGGHAVVAYGYTETSDGYCVSVWDPNDMTGPITLVISEDFRTSSFEDEYYDINGRSSYMKYALTVEDGDYDYRNIQQALIDRGHSSSPTTLNAQEGTGRELVLQTNYADFQISGSDGTSAVIENGVKVSGDLQISDADCLNGLGAELQMEFDISDAGDVTYTIVPAVAVSVVTGEALASYETALTCNEAVDGFYSSVVADEAGTVVIGADGTVETAYDEDAHQVIVAVANDAQTSWYLVTIESTGTGMKVTPSGDSTEIVSRMDAQVIVKAEDDYNTLVFETIDVLAGIPVELTEDPEVPGTGVLEDQRQEMGFAVEFVTFGGTPVQTQTDIPYGQTATKPADPTRDGFVFAGWYTTIECLDGSEFSFDTPITGNITLFAKWLTDEDYTHTITFKAEGHDDIVIVVRDGASLSEAEIPAVPEKVGYEGAWDIESFSDIRSDLVVNAIYTVVEHIHSYEAVVTDPTCTEQGYTTYTCQCGESYVDDYVDALGHSYGDPVFNWAEDHSCTVTVTCDCGETLTEACEVTAVTTDPTCTEDGSVVYTATYGEASESMELVLVAKGHEFADGFCFVCGEPDPDYVPPTEPEEPTEPEQPTEPSEPEQPSGDKSWLDKLKEMFSKWWGEEDTCEHEYTTEIVDPTCTKKGYTSHTCTKCGDSYKDSYTDALGHDYVDGVCTCCGEAAPEPDAPSGGSGWRGFWDWLKGFWK